MNRMNGLTWLHISDLHIRADLPTRSDYGVVLSELLQDVEGCIKERGLQPDFIALTGDLTARGQPAEFELAGRFLQDLLDITELAKDRLFIVPGNHDVDRGRVTGYLRALHQALNDQELIAQTLTDTGLREPIFRRQTNYFEFCSQFLGLDPPLGPDQYFTAHSLRTRERQVAILGLNSSYMAWSDDDRKRLLIGKLQVLDAWKQAQAEEADLVFALMHHPFDWLQDCDEIPVKSWVRKHCQIVLHGHIHVPDIALEISCAGDTLVVPAGATLVTPDSPNSYNFARLDLDTGQATIYLRRWSPDYDVWNADPFEGSDRKFFLPPPSRARPAVPPKLRLPPDIPYFVGRRNETDLVVDRLIGSTPPTIESSQPPVTVGIWGMTGVGKTCLALHVAHNKKVQERFPDGVLWADLSQRDAKHGSVDPKDVLVDWAAQLGSDVHAFRSLETRADHVKELLAGRRFLCVLDDARNRDVLADLLPTIRGCAALLISQSRDVVAEFDSDPIELAKMTPEEAEQIFRRALGSERVDAEIGAVQQIADTLGHLPIALDLVAAKLASEDEPKLADMAIYLASPREHFKDVEDNYPKVRVGFYTAFEGLSPRQKTRFRRLAVFGSDSFDALAVAALGTEDRVGVVEEEDAAEESLEQLRQLSMLELVEETLQEKTGEEQAERRRWSLHPLLHYYARAELKSAQEGNEVTRCAAQHFCSLAKRLVREGESENESAWIELEGLRPHITRSLKWYQEDSPKEFVRHVLDIFRFYYVRGHWEEAEERLCEALSACQEGMAAEDALLKKNLSLLHYRHGKLDEALSLLQEALAESNQLGNKRETASILIRIGWIHEDRSVTKAAYDEADSFYEQALRISLDLLDSTHEERQEREEMIARARHQIANVAFLQGDLPKARRLYEFSIDLKQQLGDRRELSKGWRQLAMVEREEGNLQKARKLLEESLDYEKSTGELRKLNICLTRLALVKAEIGICRRDGTLLAEALDHAQEANQLAEQLNHPWGEANACYAIGFTYLVKGQWDQAEEYLEMSRERRDMINDISRLASSHSRLGQLAELRGDAGADEAIQAQRYVAALGHYVRAHDYKQQIGDEKHVREATDLAGRVGQKLRRLQATARDPDQAGRILSLRVRLGCARTACDYECSKCHRDLAEAMGAMACVTYAYLSGTAGLDSRLHIVFDSSSCSKDEIVREIKNTRTQLGYFLVPHAEACTVHAELSIDDLRDMCPAEPVQSVGWSEE